MSRGEQFFYVLSLLCIITGVLGAATFAFYLTRGGNLVYEDTKLATSTLILGLISFLAFRALPGYFGWRGFKTHNAQYVRIALLLIAVALVLTLGFQNRFPGVGTGWLLPGVYFIITFRYLRALTKEQREKDSQFIQGPEDGPRLHK